VWVTGAGVALAPSHRDADRRPNGRRRNVDTERLRERSCSRFQRLFVALAVLGGEHDAMPAVCQNVFKLYPEVAPESCIRFSGGARYFILS
jgi:hypothetical protein